MGVGRRGVQVGVGSVGGCGETEGEGAGSWVLLCTEHRYVHRCALLPGFILLPAINPKSH